jgi:hypothetical protein
VGALCARSEFRKRCLEDALLGIDEAPEIVGIVVHAGIMIRAGTAEKRGSRLSMRREQPSENVEEDHDRPGEQRQGDETQPYNGRIDTRVIGKTGGDTHYLGVAAVDQETSVHLGFPWLRWLQAIGSEVAAETSRSAEMNAPAIMVAAWRAESKEANMDIPLVILAPDPTTGPVPTSMQGVCQLEKVV